MHRLPLGLSPQHHGSKSTVCSYQFNIRPVIVLRNCHRSIWDSIHTPDPTQGSLNRQQAAARQLPRNRSSRGRNQRFRSTPYPSATTENSSQPALQPQPQTLLQPLLQPVSPIQPLPQPVQQVQPARPTTPPQTPGTMMDSKFATTAHNGDAMDIDSPSPVRHTRIPAAPRSTPREPEQTPNAHVHRHLFYIPIQAHTIPTLDHDMIRLARLAVNTHLRQRIPIPDTLPVGTGIPHLYILIDSEQNDRGAALSVTNRRLGVMQEMIRDGLGWFIGLPYRHANFEVKFIRNRAPNLRYL
jgi:hypothetical protein